MSDDSYYTTEQVQQLYGLTCANICHIVRVHHISKVKVGVMNLLLNDKEAASIYYGIMAIAAKNIIDLDSPKSIEAATDKFLSGMSWHGLTDFQQECVTSWTKLFATNEVQFTDNAIDNFLAFVDHMSCSADTYVSLGGSNGCADQLTNWDVIQKVGLEAPIKKKTYEQSR